MNTDTKEKILRYIEVNAPVTIKDLEQEFSISRVMIHKHMVSLLGDGKIYKKGGAPKVAYFPVKERIESRDIPSMPMETENFFETHFLSVSPNGTLESGLKGFVRWCERRWLDPQMELSTYQKTWSKYDERKEDGLIDGIGKMRKTFPSVYLDELYYIDFYSIEKYGKTKLGNLMYIAKQNGDRKMIREIIGIIGPVISRLLAEKHIDSYGFIPPSIERKVQLLDEIRVGLRIHLPEIAIEKYFSGVRIAQKSLAKTEERIENARETIYPIGSVSQYKQTILIDDALGSWATLNETAKKLKDKWYTNRIIWLAIVGSANGFDVIKEL